MHVHCSALGTSSTGIAIEINDSANGPCGAENGSSEWVAQSSDEKRTQQGCVVFGEVSVSALS